MEDPVKIDEVSNNKTSVNPGDRAFEAEYVLKNNNEVGNGIQMQNEVQDAESKNNSKDDLENEDVEKDSEDD